MRKPLYLLISVVVVLAVVAVDGLGRGETPLTEGPPIFDPTHVLRIVLFALASWLAVRGLCPGADRRPDDVAPGRWARVGLGATLLVSAACVALFAADPVAFNRLCLEDAPVENLSALLLFMASILLFWVAFRLRRAPRFVRGGTVLLAGFVLLIGLEEVSWFQRAAGVPTPKVFAEYNWEDEINLHNLATDFSEDVYYFGAFAGLVLLPFAVPGAASDRPLVRFFAPGPWAQNFAAVPVGYNYDMWNEPAMQLALWATLAILAHRARDARDGGAKWLLAAIAAMIVAGQIVFLALGRAFVREWDVTEYREMFIPLAILVYALELRRRALVISSSR